MLQRRAHLAHRCPPAQIFIDAVANVGGELLMPVGIVVLVSGGWWILSARRWFSGPRVQETPEELAAIERELEAVGAPEVATTPPE